MKEFWNNNQFEIRVLPTQIDRYVPSDKPNADGAIFAFVLGVNPEAILLTETDGTEWTYAWARLGKAKLTGKLDDQQVWEAPIGVADNDAVAGYTTINRGVIVRANPEDDVKPNAAETKPDLNQ